MFVCCQGFHKSLIQIVMCAGVSQSSCDWSTGRHNESCLLYILVSQQSVPTMNKNSLSTNEELYPGEFLTSLNGKYKAKFQVGYVTRLHTLLLFICFIMFIDVSNKVPSECHWITHFALRLQMTNVPFDRSTRYKLSNYKFVKKNNRTSSRPIVVPNYLGIS